MDKTCAACRAFCEEFRQCRLHPFPVDVSHAYWCLDWQAKERPKTSIQLCEEAFIEEFERFWTLYPKKVGKKLARKAFRNAQDRPRIDDLLAAVERAKRSPQWAKENGQFIPHPATWLNRGQWADVPVEAKPSVFEEFLARGEEHDEIEG